MKLLSLFWRPAKSGDTPGQVEPDDAPARDIDAAHPWGWVTCTYCGRAAGIGMLHVCPERGTLR